MEQERRVEAVVDGDVDLAAAAAGGVEDEGARGAVALRQVLVKQIDPLLLGGDAFGDGVFEEVAHVEAGEHFVLELEKDFVEIDMAAVFGSGHISIDDWVIED